MRIVQLGPFPPPHGGVQTNVVAIREYVRKHGICCAVINLNRFRRPDSDEVYYPKTAFQVLKLLGRLPSDIIHIHYGGKLSLRLQVMGLICTLMPGKKTVMTFHSGGYPSSPEGRKTHFWSFRAFVFRRFDALIGVNQEILDLFQKMGVHPERTQLIYPHYVGPGAASADLPERARAFFESHQPLLLTVGLLEPEYDLKLQIDSLEQVRERHPQAGLVIAGAGSLAYIAVRTLATTVPRQALVGPHSRTARTTTGPAGPVQASTPSPTTGVPTAGPSDVRGSSARVVGSSSAHGSRTASWASNASTPGSPASCRYSAAGVAPSQVAGRGDPARTGRRLLLAAALSLTLRHPEAEDDFRHAFGSVTSRYDRIGAVPTYRA